MKLSFGTMHENQKIPKSGEKSSLFPGVHGALPSPLHSLENVRKTARGDSRPIPAGTDGPECPPWSLE